METDPLCNLVEKFMRCPKCKSKMSLQFETITIASSVLVKCCNKDCPFIEYGEPAAAARLSHLNDNYGRNTDFALNIMYVLGTMFNGDGSAESGRLLGLLGLPNSVTMETTNFALIEERIAPVIWKVHEEILDENLEEEVQASCLENDFQLWKLSKQANTNINLNSNYPAVNFSFDTGWNQRGQLYNSPSSHSFFFGMNK